MFNMFEFEYINIYINIKTFAVSCFFKPMSQKIHCLSCSNVNICGFSFSVMRVDYIFLSFYVSDRK